MKLNKMMEQNKSNILAPARPRIESQNTNVELSISSKSIGSDANETVIN